MTIELRDGRYVSTMWYVEGRQRNWLCMLYRDPGGSWRFTYRFRYLVNDDLTAGSKDEKSWYEGGAPASVPESEMIAGLDEVAEMVRVECGGELHKLLVRSDRAADQMAALRREDFAHMAPVPKQGGDSR